MKVVAAIICIFGTGIGWWAMQLGSSPRRMVVDPGKLGSENLQAEGERGRPAANPMPVTSGKDHRDGRQTDAVQEQ